MIAEAVPIGYGMRTWPSYRNTVLTSSTLLETGFFGIRLSVRSLNVLDLLTIDARWRFHLLLVMPTPPSHIRGLVQDCWQGWRFRESFRESPHLEYSSVLMAKVD